MRIVFKLMVLAVFAVGASLTVGCGETAAPSGDTPNAESTESSTEDGGSSTSAVAPEGAEGQVSSVSFEVTGMS